MRDTVCDGNNRGGEVVKEIVYKNILDNMRDGVMTIGIDGIIITFNNAAEIILNLKSGDVVNRTFGEVFLVAEENDEFNQTILNAVYESAMAHNARVHYKTSEKDLVLNVTTSFLKSPEGKEDENVHCERTEIDRFHRP